MLTAGMRYRRHRHRAVPGGRRPEGDPGTDRRDPPRLPDPRIARGARFEFRLPRSSETMPRRHAPPVRIPVLKIRAFELMTRLAFITQPSAVSERAAIHPSAKEIGEIVEPFRSAARPNATTAPALRPGHKVETNSVPCPAAVKFGCEPRRRDRSHPERLLSPVNNTTSKHRQFTRFTGVASAQPQTHCLHHRPPRQTLHSSEGHL